MKPQTVHLAAQLLRHQRGTLTAIEKWIGSQEPAPALDDLREVIALNRRMLAAYERALIGVEVEV